MLLALNVAQTLRDLSPLKSVGLHKLKGARRDQWAMTVNGPWRICFEFRRGDAHNVEIVDYHQVPTGGQVHGTDFASGPVVEA